MSRQSWRSAVKLLQVLFGAAFVIFFLYVIGPLEGYFFPVVGKTKLTEVTDHGDGFSIIYGASAKLRPECRFDHIEWYLGLQGESTRADVQFLETAANRPKGPFVFGPWLVQLTPEQLLHRSRAVVFHRCHDIVVFGVTLLHPWLTQSVYWDSKWGDGK